MQNNRSITFALCSAGAILCAGALTGCGPFGKFGMQKQAKPPEMSPRERGREAVAQYETRRDTAQYEAALSYWHHGDAKSSRQHLESVLKRNPTHAEARMLAIELALSSEDLEGAQRHADEALKHHSDDARALDLAGLAYEAVGDHETAAACFAQADELGALGESQDSEVITASATGPASTRGQNPHTTLLAAEICLAIGRLDDARRLTKAAHGAEELDDAVLALQARLAQASGAELATSADAAPADSTAEEAPAMIPTGSNDPAAEPRPLKVAARPAEPAELDAPALTADDELRRAQAAFDAGAFESAGAMMRRAIEMAGGNDRTALAAVVFALRNSQPELAVELGESGLAKCPRSAALNRALGAAHYQLGEWEASEAALSRSLSLDKSNPLSYFLMGSTLTRLGRDDEAERFYHRARQLDPRYAQRR